MGEIAAIEQDLIEEFSLFDNWMDRYQYIIDLGRELPDFPEDERVDENLLHGCQSQVWLTFQPDNGRLSFRATSDSAIVSGLIALVSRVYSGREAAEIVNNSADFIAAIGLDAHLSPTRSNGLHSMIQAIKAEAGACAG